jgi:hypothetical protein
MCTESSQKYTDCIAIANHNTINSANFTGFCNYVEAPRSTNERKCSFWSWTSDFQR